MSGRRFRPLEPAEIALAGALLVLRLSGLSRLPLVGDERITDLAARSLRAGRLILPSIQGIIPTGLSTLSSLIFGPTPFALRIPAVLAGVATAWLALRMARRWGGWPSGLAAFLILALSPWENDFERLATPYPIIRFFVVLASYGCFETWIAGRAGFRPLVWVAGLGAILSGSAGWIVFAVALPALAVPEDGPAGRRRFRAFVLMALVSVLLVPVLLAGDLLSFGGLGLALPEGEIFRHYDTYLLKGASQWFPRAGIAALASLLVLVLSRARRKNRGEAANERTVVAVETSLPEPIFYVAAVLFVLLVPTGHLRIGRKVVLYYLIHPWVAVLLPLAIQASLARLRIPGRLATVLAAVAAVYLADGTSLGESWRAPAQVKPRAMSVESLRLASGSFSVEGEPVSEFVRASLLAGPPDN